MALAINTHAQTILPTLDKLLGLKIDHKPFLLPFYSLTINSLFDDGH